MLSPHNLHFWIHLLSREYKNFNETFFVYINLQITNFKKKLINLIMNKEFEIVSKCIGFLSYRVRLTIKILTK